MTIEYIFKEKSLLTFLILSKAFQFFLVEIIQTLVTSIHFKYYMYS